MYTLGKRSLENLKGVHPDLIKVMEAAITDSPIEFIITDGVRTAEQQQDIYSKGRTSPGIIVSYCDGIKKKSNHQVKDDGYGHAIDMYTDTNCNGKIDAEEIRDVEGLKKVAAHIKSIADVLGIRIEWGGDWKIKDYPHFELKQP